jgi:hypothetical protein
MSHSLLQMTSQKQQGNQLGRDVMSTRALAIPFQQKLHVYLKIITIYICELPWMHILCSKSLQKHDTQWSQPPLPRQCPLPVQQKHMGCTFFWNSREKQTDLIHLRLPPTKQMDHLPTLPNAKHSQIIQMFWRVYLLYCHWSQHGILDNPCLYTNLRNACARSPWGK